MNYLTYYWMWFCCATVGFSLYARLWLNRVTKTMSEFDSCVLLNHASLSSKVWKIAWDFCTHILFIRITWIWINVDLSEKTSIFRNAISIFSRCCENELHYAYCLLFISSSMKLLSLPIAWQLLSGSFMSFLEAK